MVGVIVMPDCKTEFSLLGSVLLLVSCREHIQKFVNKNALKDWLTYRVIPHIHINMLFNSIENRNNNDKLKNQARVESKHLSLGSQHTNISKSLPNFFFFPLYFTLALYL